MSFREARKKAGLLQEDVAKALNVKQSTVACWESGRNMPSAKLWPKLAKLYKCSIEKLLQGNEEKQKAAM